MDTKSAPRFKILETMTCPILIGGSTLTLDIKFMQSMSRVLWIGILVLTGNNLDKPLFANTVAVRTLTGELNSAIA